MHIVVYWKSFDTHTNESKLYELSEPLATVNSIGKILLAISTSKIEEAIKKLEKGSYSYDNKQQNYWWLFIKWTVICTVFDFHCTNDSHLQAAFRIIKIWKYWDASKNIKPICPLKNVLCGA